MITVLRAQGPNKLEVIAMVFATMADGEKFMDAIVEPFKDAMQNVVISGNRKDGFVYGNVPAVKKNVSEDGLKIDYNIRYEFLDRQDEEDNYIVHNKIFTSYYDGCGSVNGYSLETVEFGTKLIGWNLD